MGSTCSQRDSVPFRPPAGLSKAAPGPHGGAAQHPGELLPAPPLAGPGGAAVRGAGEARRAAACRPPGSEVPPQITTWFQNGRVKLPQQLQHPQTGLPLPGALCVPPAFCLPPSALGSSLQLLHLWASLPGPGPVQRALGPVCPARGQGRLLRKCGSPEARSWACAELRLPPTSCWFPGVGLVARLRVLEGSKLKMI